MRLTMKKIRLLSVAIGLAILGGGRLSADPDRPNVIFILCDDLGNGDVGTLFQNDKIGKKQRTPHLDTM
ncbi:MAG: hypothetical protein FJ220_02050, partial [Kiritimatiellaceae bacterium]|nr:hypothetical protein [Kiritimatiellaceae bacterium]